MQRCQIRRLGRLQGFRVHGHGYWAPIDTVSHAPGYCLIPSRDSFVGTSNWAVAMPSLVSIAFLGHWVRHSELSPPTVTLSCLWSNWSEAHPGNNATDMRPGSSSVTQGVIQGVTFTWQFRMSLLRVLFTPQLKDWKHVLNNNFQRMHTCNDTYNSMCISTCSSRHNSTCRY